MHMAVFTYEVPEEMQEKYLKVTAETIKPFWEAHECFSYEVYHDYFVSPTRFVKIQFYEDKETMERSLALAREDPRGKEIVALFMKYVNVKTLEQRRVFPRINKDGIV